jgi:CubicO group peptidase (beta-lactamase class C family)
MTTQSPTRARGRGASDLDEAAVRDVTTCVLTQRPSAGVAVAVVRDEHPTWFHLRGVADTASRRPVSTKAVFRIGSLTKVVTAVAVLQLWEEGRISLDAPANDYVRSFEVTRARPELHPATVRHLRTLWVGRGRSLLLHGPHGVRQVTGCAESAAPRGYRTVRGRRSDRRARAARPGGKEMITWSR